MLIPRKVTVPIYSWKMLNVHAMKLIIFENLIRRVRHRRDRKYYRDRVRNCDDGEYFHQNAFPSRRGYISAKSVHGSSKVIEREAIASAYRWGEEKEKTVDEKLFAKWYSRERGGRLAESEKWPLAGGFCRATICKLWESTRREVSEVQIQGRASTDVYSRVKPVWGSARRSRSRKSVRRVTTTGKGRNIWVRVSLLFSSEKW